jgi:hypothetical protein
LNSELSHRLKWAQHVASKKRIFLDLSFWLQLRDGRSVEANIFLGKARDLVQAGKVIFPVTQMVIHEVLKQSDATSRKRTLALFDELTTGAVLEPEADCVVHETTKFLELTLGTTGYCAPPCLLWTKPAHFFGHGRFTTTISDAVLAKNINDELFAFTWSLTFIDIANILPNSDLLDLSFDATAQMLNNETDDNQHQLTTFEQLLRDEIYGSVDAFLPSITAGYSTYCSFHGQPSPSKLPKETKTVLANCLILKPEIQRVMPTIFSNASFHALLRWNRTQPFKGNDLFDSAHLASALAYCHAYFGERSLCDLGNRAPLRLFSFFGVRHASNFTTALQELETLAADDDVSG